MSFSTTSSSSDLQHKKLQPTTAFKPQPCLPLQNSPRHTPPQPAFEQDFALFATPTKLAHSPSVRSLDLTQLPTYKQSDSQNCHATALLPTRTAQKVPDVCPQSFKNSLPLPPVPTYPWKSSDSLNKKPNIFTTDNIANMSLYNFNEPNVAYNGTSSDLNLDIGGCLKNGADMPLYSDDSTSMNALWAEAFGTHGTHGTQNVQTVSPEQLSMDTMGSVPSSTMIPELSPNGSDLQYSPALSDLDTPLFGAESYNTTPYMNDNMAYPANDYPLFSSNETSAFEVPSPQQFAPVIPEARQRSFTAASVTASPSMGARPTGIRKKSKANAPIIVDENDPVAVKRAKNTMAARKSRAKKMSYTDELEAKVASLEAQLAAAQQLITQLGGQANTSPVQQQAEINDDDFARILNSSV